MAIFQVGVDELLWMFKFKPKFKLEYKCKFKCKFKTN